MKKIELSIPATMSLLVHSSSGSEELDIENMSDEEFANLSEDQFASATAEDNEENNNDDGVSDTDVGDIDNNSLGDDDDDNPENDSNQEEPPATAEGDGSEEDEGNGESEGNQPSEEEQSGNEYEAVYNELFGQPIKASGREVQLRDVNQVRNLVEMGVDYNKKMQHMRPHMQTLKTLEKEGILGDEDQLNLLLEAKQGKPEAIRKLISQANIDIVDLADDDGSGDYTPDNHIVTAQEVEIEQALSAIKGTQSYSRTIDVMSNSFDDESKKIMSKNPQYITSLNSDIETGVYDQVMEMVQYQRDVKAIPNNVSDIEAYIHTVQQLAAQEAAQGQPNAEPQPGMQEHPDNTRRSTGASRKRKTAMSGNRGGSKKKEQTFDPLAAMEMSDEEFMKQYGNKLI